jgi:hypothetical protein
LVPFLRPFMKAPAEGAATSIHLASAPELARVTGRYFAKGRPRRSSKASYDGRVGESGVTALAGRCEFGHRSA